MVCNFCGSMLDERTAECPYCGHSTGVVMDPDTDTGTDKDPAAAAGNENSIPEQRRKQASRAGTAGRFARIANAGCAVCVLVSVICLFSVGSIRREADTYRQELTDRLAGMRSMEQQLEQRIRSSGSGTGTDASGADADANTSGTINITKQPTDSATYLGRGGSLDNKQDVPVFTVTAAGSGMEFTWQRYEDGNRKWTDIALDENGCNEELGLRVIGSLDGAYSELAAHDVKSIAYGTYRCKISDPNGVVYSDAVALTQRDNK